MGEDSDKRNRSKAFWILLLVAMAVAWFFFQPDEQNGASQADLQADRMAALGADPDDILVDLVDHASAEQVAAIERQLGIDLVLVSDQSEDEQFYRAHVPAERRDAILAELSKHRAVEIAKPDATFMLDPNSMVRAPLIDA